MSKNLQNEFKLENGQIVRFDVEKLQIEENDKIVQLNTKSELFRRLYDNGLEIAEIARITESHYSFVYGVISNSREIRKVKKITKSDTIREMYDEGKKVGEIAKELNSNYSFVFSVVKKYKNEKEAK